MMKKARRAELLERERKRVQAMWKYQAASCHKQGILYRIQSVAALINILHSLPIRTMSRSKWATSLALNGPAP